MFPQCGTMWSTSVALLRMPDLPHSRHQGSAASCDGRRSRIQISSLYSLCQFLAASLRCSDRCGLCLSQYPSGTSAAHPGCRHGLKGFVPMGYHLQGKNKSAQATSSLFGSSLAQALVLLDAGSGASIFTITFASQRLHFNSRSRTTVVGKTGNSFFF